MWGFSSYAGRSPLTPGNVGPESEQPITTQCLITINADSDPNMQVHRKAEAARSKPGTVINAQYLEAEQLKIEPGELFFIEKDQQFSGGGKTAFRLHGFSSFNGINTYGETQEQFEDRFLCLGFVTGVHYADGEVVSRSGVAVQKAGSGTTINNSLEVFSPGDVFGVEYPAINEKERERQFHTVAYRHRGNYSVRKKAVGILKKITYEDISDTFAEVAQTVVFRRDLNVPRYRQQMLTGMSSGRSENEQHALSTKKFLAYHSYNTIMGAIERGLVVPTVSPLADVSIPEVRLAWEQTRDPIANSAPTAIKDFMWTNTEFREVTGTQKTERDVAYHAQAEYFATILGLAMPHTQFNASTTLEDTALLVNINRRTLFGSLQHLKGGAHSAWWTETEAYVGHEFTRFDTSAETRNRFGTLASVAPSIARQMMSIAGEASVEYVRFNGKVYDRTYRSALGTISNYAPPNRTAHYVLG